MTESKKYKKSLFIFRRDLRYEDNTGLQFALAQSESVIAAFIIDPAQVGAHNRYKSDAALQFMIQALDDLGATLSKKKGRLYFFFGTPAEVVKKLAKQEKIEAVFVNRDYTPYSIRRDLLLDAGCKQLGVVFHSCDDVLLQEPDAVKKKTGGFYSVFTPFFRAMMKLPMRSVVATSFKNFYTKPVNGSCSSIREKINYSPNKDIPIKGSRSACLRILKHIGRFEQYDRNRDFPAMDATTHLSAYIKFGVCSIREVYAAVVSELGKGHSLVRQLCWRDFFTHIAYHTPYIFGAPYHKKYEKLSWINDKKVFAKWCTGETGFPLVDAGMRQLVATGFMHNRVRMITASFLVKDLHIDWRLGERFFATHLVDYDPSVNNGNWQWVTSTGCDAQPYFRIFNPWLQQKRYDRDCAYIKRWVPELKDVPSNDIHNWYKAHQKYKKTYLLPMVDHEDERGVARKIYAKI